MSAQALQRLDFMVSLIDKVSGPAGKMMKTMDSVTTNIQSGFTKIAYGSAGLIGVAYALDRIVGPAKNVRTALGTIASLGVGSGGIDSLRVTSMATAVQFGKDTSEIIAASYLLQSAIANLKGNELDMLTHKSTLLATATKGGLDSTNAYVGQMFNIHAVQADAMGKTDFMNSLVAKTAKAVQLFNTDGNKMGEAMKNIGKQATAMGVPLSEQAAITGFLQNTMVEGSRSGTAYLAFLSNISKAEKVSGMTFTDQSGKVLPIVDIVTKLEAKFGDLSKAADQQLLQKMFGKRGQAVISAMAGSLDTFKGQLSDVQNAKGLDNVMKMAMAITDPWDRAASAVKNFRIQFGDKMLTTLIPFYNETTEIMSTLTKWMDLFPNLTSAVIKTVFGILGLVASLAALSIVVGISKFLMVGWAVATGLAKIAMMPFGPLLKIMRFGWLVLNSSVLAGNGIMAASRASMAAMWMMMKVGVAQSALVTGAVWLFNGGLKALAMTVWANPITWLVVGIVALIATVVAAIVYWDEWTGKLVEWGQAFHDFIGLTSFVDGVLAAWDKLPQWFSNFKTWLGTLDPFAFINDQVQGFMSNISGALGFIGIDVGSNIETPKPIAPPASLQSSQSGALAGGGLVQQISNASSANNSRTMGDISIYNSGEAMNGQTLADELAFAAG